VWDPISAALLRLRLLHGGRRGARDDRAGGQGDTPTRNACYTTANDRVPAKVLPHLTIDIDAGECNLIWRTGPALTSP
jgi:hypothetical protein